MANEAVIEDAIQLAYCRAGWSCLHLEPDGIRIPKGWPDLLCMGPGAKALFIEVKDPDDPIPDPIQVWYHKLLRNLGFTVIVATSVDEAMGPLLEVE